MWLNRTRSIDSLSGCACKRVFLQGGCSAWLACRKCFDVNFEPGIAVANLDSNMETHRMRLPDCSQTCLGHGRVMETSVPIHDFQRGDVPLTLWSPVDCKLQDSTVELPELRQVVLLNARDFGGRRQSTGNGESTF